MPTGWTTWSPISAPAKPQPSASCGKGPVIERGFFCGPPGVDSPRPPVQLTIGLFSLQGNAAALKTALARIVLAVVLPLSGLAHPDPLAGSEWRPTCMQGRALPADVTAFIQFRGGGRLLGHTGCNRLLGEYRIDDRQIHLGPLSSTRKACDAGVMRQEHALIGALQKASSFRRARTRLVLFGADGLPTLELRQTDWD